MLFIVKFLLLGMLYSWIKSCRILSETTIILSTFEYALFISDLTNLLIKLFNLRYWIDNILWTVTIVVASMSNFDTRTLLRSRNENMISGEKEDAYFLNFLKSIFCWIYLITIFAELFFKPEAAIVSLFPYKENILVQDP